MDRSEPVTAPAGAVIGRSCSRKPLITDQLGALDCGLLIIGLDAPKTASGACAGISDLTLGSQGMLLSLVSLGG